MKCTVIIYCIFSVLYTFLFCKNFCSKVVEDKTLKYKLDDVLELAHNKVKRDVCTSVPPRFEIRAIMVSCNECPNRKHYRSYYKKAGFADSSTLSLRNCSKKVVITLKITNTGFTDCKSQYVVLDHVFDPSTETKQRLLYPYVIKIRQNPMFQTYGLNYEYSVNEKARELVTKHPKSRKSCKKHKSHIKKKDESDAVADQGFCCPGRNKRDLKNNKKSSNGLPITKNKLNKASVAKTPFSGVVDKNHLETKIANDLLATVSQNNIKKENWPKSFSNQLKNGDLQLNADADYYRTTLFRSGRTEKNNIDVNKDDLDHKMNAEAMLKRLNELQEKTNKIQEDYLDSNRKILFEPSGQNDGTLLSDTKLICNQQNQNGRLIKTKNQGLPNLSHKNKDFITEKSYSDIKDDQNVPDIVDNRNMISDQPIKLQKNLNRFGYSSLDSNQHYWNDLEEKNLKLENSENKFGPNSIKENDNMKANLRNLGAVNVQQESLEKFSNYDNDDMNDNRNPFSNRFNSEYKIQDQSVNDQNHLLERNNVNKIDNLKQQQDISTNKIFSTETTNLAQKNKADSLPMNEKDMLEVDRTNSFSSEPLTNQNYLKNDEMNNNSLSMGIPSDEHNGLSKILDAEKNDSQKSDLDESGISVEPKQYELSSSGQIVPIFRSQNQSSSSELPNIVTRTETDNDKTLPDKQQNQLKTPNEPENIGPMENFINTEKTCNIEFDQLENTKSLNSNSEKVEENLESTEGGSSENINLIKSKTTLEMGFEKTIENNQQLVKKVSLPGQRFQLKPGNSQVRKGHDETFFRRPNFDVTDLYVGKRALGDDDTDNINKNVQDINKGETEVELSGDSKSSEEQGIKDKTNINQSNEAADHSDEKLLYDPNQVDRNNESNDEYLATPSESAEGENKEEIPLDNIHKEIRPNMNNHRKHEKHHHDRTESISYQSYHSMTHSKLWFGVFKFCEPYILHDLFLEIFEKHEDDFGRLQWRDLTNGEPIQVGSKSSQDGNRMGTVWVQYVTKEPSECAFSINPDVSNLLIPQPVGICDEESFPELKGGPDEYLVVPNNMITSDGTSCDKAGVGYKAFTNQKDRCKRQKGACLSNQPRDMWEHDHDLEQMRKKGTFFLKYYGHLPPNPVRNSSTGQNLTMFYTETYSTNVDIQVKADFNIVLRPHSSARLTEVYIDATNCRKTMVTVKVTNSALVQGAFYVALRECSLSLPAKFSNILTKPALIPPQHQHIFNIEIECPLPIRKFWCSVDVMNIKQEIVAYRRIRFQKEDRCICIWHCVCTCLDTDNGLKCQPLPLDHYAAAGFRGGLSMATRYVRYTLLDEILTFILYFCLFMCFVLLALGIIKAFMGICCVEIGLWGLDIVLGLPREMNRYYEKKLSSRCVQYDLFGWPIHPETHNKTRNISLPAEFAVNVIFFLIFPMVIMWSLTKRICFPDSDECKPKHKRPCPAKKLKQSICRICKKLDCLKCIRLNRNKQHPPKSKKHCNRNIVQVTRYSDTSSRSGSLSSSKSRDTDALYASRCCMESPSSENLRASDVYNDIDGRNNMFRNESNCTCHPRKTVSIVCQQKDSIEDDSEVGISKTNSSIYLSSQKGPRVCSARVPKRDTGTATPKKSLDFFSRPVSSKNQGKTKGWGVWKFWSSESSSKSRAARTKGRPNTYSKKPKSICKVNLLPPKSSRLNPKKQTEKTRSHRNSCPNVICSDRVVSSSKSSFYRHPIPSSNLCSASLHVCQSPSVSRKRTTTSDEDNSGSLCSNSSRPSLRSRPKDYRPSGSSPSFRERSGSRVVSEQRGSSQCSAYKRPSKSRFRERKR